MARYVALICLLCWPLTLLAAAPMRIVSLTPHLTELLFAIGAGDRIVATDDASDFPPEVTTRPHVANYRSINLEALLARCEELLNESSEERGALWGVPFAVKDNIDVARVPTTATCPAFKYVPQRSAPAVEALLKAGAS